MHPADITALADAFAQAIASRLPAALAALQENQQYAPDTLPGTFTATSTELAAALGYQRSWVYRNQDRLVSRWFGRQRMYDVAASRALYLSTERQTRRRASQQTAASASSSPRSTAAAPGPAGRRRVNPSDL